MLFFENYVVWLNDILIVIQKPRIILYLFTKTPAHLNILFDSKLGHNETERKVYLRKIKVASWNVFHFFLWEG